MARSALGCLVGLIVATACGTANGQGSEPVAAPSPPKEALAAWESFPVHASPRPIVWLSSPNPEKGYIDSEHKIAGLCNKLALAPGLRLSSAPPKHATVSWRSGATDSYAAISQAAAFSAMSRTSGDTSSECAAIKPLVITAARLGDARFGTDRGTAQMSAWLFEATGVNGVFSYPAVVQSAFWHGGMTGGADVRTGARVSADGLTLTVGVVGAPNTPGPCGADYTASAAESETAVGVAVKGTPHGGTGNCDLVGYFRTVTVHLSAPLGGRVLLNAQGDVEIVCPETGDC